MRIYLAKGSTNAAVIVAYSEADIDLARLAPALGRPVELYEVGIAHSSTPEGPLLCGPANEVNPRRPLGQRVNP